MLQIFAQTDTSTYRIIMNNGTRFNCKILEMKRGEFIKVLQENNTTATIDWAAFNDYQNVTEELLKEEQVKSKRQEQEKRLIEKQREQEKRAEENEVNKIKAKHKSWLRCFIILNTGDTITGKVKSKNDYADMSIGANTRIRFASKNDTESTFSPHEFKELYLPDEPEEFKKFIVVGGYEDSSRTQIYRVTTDGTCKLLCHSITGGPTPMGGSSSIESCLMYYRGSLYNIATEGSFDTSSTFVKKCSEIFRQCPTLVKKIQNKTYRTTDLSEIIKEFNQCLDTQK